MLRAELSLRSRAHVEGGAEVVVATATVDYAKARYLSREGGFALLYEKLLEFLSQPRKHIGEQRWLPRMRWNDLGLIRQAQSDRLSRQPPRYK